MGSIKQSWWVLPSLIGFAKAAIISSFLLIQSCIAVELKSILPTGLPSSPANELVYKV